MNETRQLAEAFRKLADALHKVPDGIEVQSRKCGERGVTPCLDIHVDLQDGRYASGVCVCRDSPSLTDSLTYLAAGVLALTAAAKRIATCGVPAQCPMENTHLSNETLTHMSGDEYLCGCGCRFIWAGEFRWDTLEKLKKESNEQTKETKAG